MERYREWFTLADHYCIVEPIHEVMSRLSHREVKARLQWIQEQWNKPTATHYYLMRIAQRVQQVLAGKQRDNITMDHQRVNFERKVVEKLSSTGLTKEEATRIAKARWGIIVGLQPEEISDGDGN